ncbi:hypothetical protein NJT12_24285 [Flavobacterium sp. AC]|uniref:Uncharacterized protein n=1 Tax=Flavobacterium azizsancarii TaxID=2961580 RepID=A0ABT4WJW0_9FLAO|nr:hypothetical protein [Flavobacterium azizsancarii]MDA6072746.1 hypothetical protein [Flavobacterium azizsancarii]
MKATIKILIVLIIFAIPELNFAQGAAVVNAQTGHASAVLDLSNNTAKRAFLPPRVVLSTLTDKVNPITSPAAGLIVYNIGTTQLPGYYIFDNGVWNLMATRENSVVNAIFTKTPSEVKTISTAYSNVTGFTKFFNNSGIGISDDENSTITLQPGKYVANVSFNISTNETTTNGIGTTIKTQAHFYSGRLWNGSKMLGPEIQLNEISNTSGTKKHAVTFVFSFELTTSDSFQFQLARRNGGTYTGTISIDNAFINIEKSLP